MKQVLHKKCVSGLTYDPVWYLAIVDATAIDVVLLEIDDAFPEIYAVGPATGDVSRASDDESLAIGGACRQAIAGESRQLVLDHVMKVPGTSSSYQEATDTTCGIFR